VYCYEKQPADSADAGYFRLNQDTLDPVADPILISCCKVTHFYFLTDALYNLEDFLYFDCDTSDPYYCMLKVECCEGGNTCYEADGITEIDLGDDNFCGIMYYSFE